MKARRLSLCAFLASIAVLALLVLTRAWPTVAQTPPITDPANTTAPAETTPDAENVELVGHIGGPTFAIFVEGSYAYVGEGPRLTILDISNPASPTVVGKTLPLPGIVRDVHVSGSYAYVAADEAGLRVVDVSDPAAPAEVGSRDTWGNAYGVTVAESYAYVTDGSEGLWIVNVTDPATPEAVGRCNTPGTAHGVAVAWPYAYVADGSSGLRVVVVSNPNIPTEVGSTDTPGTAYGVAVAWPYAYVADGQSGLRMVTIVTPTKPTEVGYHNTPGTAHGVAVAGDYAYVADGSRGLQVINVSMPPTLTRAGYYDTPLIAWSVAMAEDIAYVADYDSLRAVKVSPPTTPTEVGFHGTSGPILAYGVTVKGDPPTAQPGLSKAGLGQLYAYVADHLKGLQVVDVSTPADPTDVGMCETSVGPRDVAAAGDTAYLVGGTDQPTISGWLRIVYIADPSTPEELDYHPMPWIAYDVAVAGNPSAARLDPVALSSGPVYAYVAAGSKGMRVIEVTHPTIPEEVGAFTDTRHALGVTVAWPYCHIVDNYRGLRVVDVSNPTHPEETGSLDNLEGARDVAVQEMYAYVAAGSTGLHVVDVSDLTAPAEVGSYDTPGWAYKVTVVGDYAYIADGDSGLRVVDVSDPTHPAEVGFYDTPEDAYGVTVAGDYIYVADNDGGLFILRYTAGPSPTLYPISNRDGDGDYLVDWSDVAGTLSYTLQEDDNAGFASPTTRYIGSVSQVTISGQAAGTWYYRVKAASASGESGWSNVESTSVGDAYEPDDTCAQATALATDGTLQSHTFHQHADEDWAHFTAVSGTTYVVQAVHTGTGADLELELHDACDQPPLPPDDEDTFGNTARLIFTATSDGTYYVRALNHDPAVYGPDVSYELSVRSRSPVPIVVIVAGRNEANRLEANITFMGDQAYRTFRHAGVPRENIRYLSMGEDRDADQDGHPDVDGAPTRENVHYAVRDWPSERGLQAGKPFYLYLVDHGGIDYFCADGCGDGKQVNASDLDEWLDDLEKNTGADEVNVIVAACYSGSFIGETEGEQATISSAGRVVIASTGSRRRAFPSRRGGYFSDAFFTALAHNADLWTAYVAGRTAARAVWSEQTPWLDDNGNAVVDEGDGEVARRRGLVAFGGGSIPVVDWLEAGEISESGVATITAQVRDDGAVLTVTVEVYPPGFKAPDTEEGETPVLDIDRVVLEDGDGDGVYEGTYAGFTEEGIYRLVAHAWDDDQNLSLPRQTNAGEQKTYLPVVARDASTW